VSRPLGGAGPVAEAGSESLGGREARPLFPKAMMCRVARAARAGQGGFVTDPSRRGVAKDAAAGWRAAPGGA